MSMSSRRSASLVLVISLLGALAGHARAQSGGSFITTGEGCPGVTDDTGPVLYGIMPAGEWHLTNTSLRFTSNGQDWSVSEGGSFILPSANATIVNSGDDVLSGPFNLPFTFHYPGGAGATTAVDINSNGRVYLESGTNPYRGGWSASQIVPNFLSATPSVCPLGVDLHAGAGGVISFDVQTVGSETVALLTWDRVPEWSTTNENTFQCQLWSNDEIVVSLVEIATGEQDAVVGVSAGGGAPDPGASPLTVPVALAVEGTPDIGYTFSILAERIPATTAVSLLAVGASVPASPIALGPLGGRPECALLVDNVLLNLPMQLAGQRSSVALDLAFVPAAIGLILECQALVVDPAQPTPLPVVVSDRGTFTIGRPPDLLFVADGENSYYGSPDRGGFFRLESSPGATHLDITHLTLSFVGTPHYFDIEGNSGVGTQGYFDVGNGVGGAACLNAYYGSDVATGLIYGGAGQAAGCGGFGTTGFVGSVLVGGIATRLQVLDFDFAPGAFASGSMFGFDCDTDGSTAFNAGAHQVFVTVTFSDGSTVSATTQLTTTDRAEGVLIP